MELELIKAVNKWVVYNFEDKRCAEEGVVEEIGEACHAKLKFRQGIRGYDEDKFRKDFADALADAVIFLCDWCALRGAYFKFKRNEITPDVVKDERRIICHVLQTASAIFNYEYINPSQEILTAESEATVYSMLAQRLVTALEYWATYYKMDLEELVYNTWEVVKKRDWKKDRVNAAVTAEVNSDGKD